MAGFNGRGGFGGGNQMQALMQQAKKMQEQVAKAQEELEAAEIEGASGGGMVTVTLSGKKKLLSISIKPEAVDPDDVEMLEDLIVAAFNDADEKVDALTQEKMGPMGGLGGF